MIILITGPCQTLTPGKLKQKTPTNNTWINQNPSSEKHLCSFSYE
jgi:hypothetical protein